MDSTKSGETGATEVGGSPDPQSGASAQPGGSNAATGALPWRGPVRVLIGQTGHTLMAKVADSIAALNAAPAGCGCRAVIEAHAAALERSAAQYPMWPLAVTSRHIAEDLRYVASKLPAPPAAEGAGAVMCAKCGTDPTQTPGMVTLAAENAVQRQEIADLSARLAAAEGKLLDREGCLVRAGWELAPNGQTWRPRLSEPTGELWQRMVAAEQARDAALAEVAEMERQRNRWRLRWCDAFGNQGDQWGRELWLACHLTALTRICAVALEERADAISMKQGAEVAMCMGTIGVYTVLKMHAQDREKYLGMLKRNMNETQFIMRERDAARRELAAVKSKGGAA